MSSHVALVLVPSRFHSPEVGVEGLSVQGVHQDDLGEVWAGSSSGEAFQRRNSGKGQASRGPLRSLARLPFSTEVRLVEDAAAGARTCVSAGL